MLDQDEMSWTNRMRRSLYTMLRDELDRILIHLALIDSYHRFQEQNQPYPFVENRDLRPKVRSFEKESTQGASFVHALAKDLCHPQKKNISEPLTTTK